MINPDVFRKLVEEHEQIFDLKYLGLHRNTFNRLTLLYIYDRTVADQMRRVIIKLTKSIKRKKKTKNKIKVIQQLQSALPAHDKICKTVRKLVDLYYRAAVKHRKPEVDIKPLESFKKFIDQEYRNLIGEKGSDEPKTD